MQRPASSWRIHLHLGRRRYTRGVTNVAQYRHSTLAQRVVQPAPFRGGALSHSCEPGIGLCATVAGGLSESIGEQGGAAKKKTSEQILGTGPNKWTDNRPPALRTAGA